MSKIYNKEINKFTDWGGDESTTNLPVSGNRILDYIKNSLDDRIGVLHYDTDSNRYLCFSDNENRDEYINDTSKVDLILGTFDAPFNYSAEINLITSNYNAIFLGAKGNYIRFTYDVKNKLGEPTGEDAIITYTIVRNSVKQVITEIGKAGQIITFNVDEYIKEGMNSITIGIRGRTSLAATVINVTYQVVNLTLTAELDITQVHDLSTGSKELEIPFTVAGLGIKTMEWYLDGVMLQYDKYVDEVVSSSATVIKYITLSNLSKGAHSLQLRAYTVVDGERFYSDTLYRDVIITDNSNMDDIIAVSGTIPVQHGVLGEGEPFKLYGMTQYIPYDLLFAVYSPKIKEFIVVDILIDGETLGNINSKNGVLNTFSIVSTIFGSSNVQLITTDMTYTIVSEVLKTPMDISEITNNLVLDFNGVGRSNSSKDRAVWNQGDYSANFNNFNWNNTSGWVNNRLLISDGASLDINYAPLAGDVTSTGKTIELEFMTTNVSDDNTILCDLRVPETGVGICIYATKITMKSITGAEIQSEFNENELVRMSLVVNRKSGSTNKQLSFIYTNGVVSRSTHWVVTDNYTSDKMISFKSTNKALIEIKQLRIYESALNNDLILNNYVLYRDDINSMVDIYERNNVYMEGTNKLDPEKMASRVPVMIFTGDIPILEDTQDKNKLIMVDIEYINMLNPETSFTMKGAALRPQGTSSMAYPKKNFRIYTLKFDTTKVYDYLGDEIEDKLYSFRAASSKEKKAQPVNCWCLKADYAESSGTHNTGVARIWNEILFNAQVDPTEIYSIDPTIPQIKDTYVFRTEALKAALKNNYQYDVRTTVDGFPILVFYRLSEGEDLIFIGKYNFNNDKSTESVFGFENVPGFNNSKMQCFEVTNNGHPLALFTDISNFDTEWDTAWESRYPDSKNPNTLPDLKRFSIWLNGINGDHERFKTEKWDHFNIYNVAAYYSYLMRFGAVDLTVKNAFLTSEDGEHYYFINYDNDTVLGVINTGDLAAPPTVDRTTKDSSGNFIYAGHDSVMWNMFESDEQFMKLVPIIDYALTTSGLNYKAVVELFNTKQSDYWVEKVYNQDAQYKYIDLFNQKGENNLFMLQGKRDLHRKWWLAKRFSIYDSKWVSGDYRSNAIVLKCLNDTPAGQKFTVTAGDELNYGYGINSGIRESGINLKEDESYTFTTAEKISVGDVFKIFGSPLMKVLDLSLMAHRLEQLNVTDVYAEHLGTRLEKLIVGRLDANNQDLVTISGLPSCKYLKELNVEGHKAMTSLDLRGLSYIEVVKATNSSIAAIVFEKGSPLNTLELPESMITLTLDQLPYLHAEGLTIGDSIQDLTVVNCENISNDFTFVYNWYKNKTVADSECSLTMDYVNWDNLNPSQLLELLQLKANGGKLSLKGKINLASITLDLLNSMNDVLGRNIFDEGGELYITAPDFINFPTLKIILEGETVKLETTVISKYKSRVTYKFLTDIRPGTELHEDTGVITTVENGLANKTILVRATHVSTKGNTITSDGEITIAKRVYPTQGTSTLKGPDTIDVVLTEYSWESTIPNITGNYITSWTLGGPAFDQGIVTIDSSDNNKCVVRRVKTASADTPANIQMTMTKVVGGATILTFTKDIVVPNYIAVSRALNPKLMTVIYNAGLSANIDILTIPEALLITASQIATVFKGTDIDSFQEFEHFIKLTEIPTECFKDCTSLKFIKLPKTIKTLNNESFYGCSVLTTVDIPSSVNFIGDGCFRDCYALNNIIIPLGVTYLGDVTFYGCKGLTTITLPEGITTMGINCFGNCTSLSTITLPSTITLLDEHCFSGCILLGSIKSKPIVAPIVKTNTFGIESSNYTGKNKSNNILLVPLISTGYDSSFWLDPLCDSAKCKFTKKEDYTATEATSLTITANDVRSDDTTTTINWIAITNGSSELTGGTITGIKQTGTATSAPFAKNTSETDSVNRTISFTYMGAVATTTISQAPIKLIVFEDPEVGRVLKSKGLIANADYSTEGELGLITSLSYTFNNNKVITKFPELKYCTKVTSMSNTFSGCSSLLEAPVIPESVTNMERTFSACTSLVNAPIIPESVTSMNYTFNGCSNLVEAPIIPASVTNMSNTFFTCTSINGIYIIKPLTPPPTYSSSLTNVVSIYVPDSSVAAYKAASGWINFADKIYPLSTKP